MSIPKQQNLSLSETFGKRQKPQLKLNTAAPHLEERKILIRKNSENGYIVENHPPATDMSKSASSKLDASRFFSLSFSPDINEEYNFKGPYYYIIQKSHGKEMQDKLKVLPKMEEVELSYFGVFDGHSSQVVPDIVAQKLDKYFVENLKSEQDIPGALRKAFKKIEEEIIAYLREKMVRGGTTALCTVFDKREVYTANLGDSQIVVFQKNSFVNLSSLHDYFNEEERKTIEQKGGIILKNRLEGELALSRSIGDYKYKKYLSSDPEITTHQLKDDDEFIILATDGYWNGLNSQQTLSKIIEFKEMCGEKEKLDLKSLGEFLFDEACKNIKTKKDNMSVIVINVKDYLCQI